MEVYHRKKGKELSFRSLPFPLNLLTYFSSIYVRIVGTPIPFHIHRDFDVTFQSNIDLWWDSTEVYRSIHETLDSGGITEEREKILKSAAEQIEYAVPDLDERVYQSNVKELEYGSQQGQRM